MATAEQMRRLHPDPPGRHHHWQQAVRLALEWRIAFDEWVNADRADLTEPVALAARADHVIAELLRYGTPGDPQ